MNFTEKKTYDKNQGCINKSIFKTPWNQQETSCSKNTARRCFDWLKYEGDGEWNGKGPWNKSQSVRQKQQKQSREAEASKRSEKRERTKWKFALAEKEAKNNDDSWCSLQSENSTIRMLSNSPKFELSTSFFPALFYRIYYDWHENHWTMLARVFT